MRRIIVVGSQGSGKTSLSRNLGQKLDLPVVHLDVLYWRSGWKPSDKANFRSRVAEAIAGDAWVVDGSFSGLAFDLTLARADTLVVIDRPRWLCQWRILWRSAFDRATARPDLPEGCPEQFDWKLMKEAWRYNTERVPAIEAERIQYGPDVPVVRLRRDRDIQGFLESVSAHGE
ncbi:AAA family ATPase [Bradyrhizobium sp. 159]|uniref:AAA family ATPase n=1 Tax=unclassified Bradyrhizobium TaxID=2631580 RepID=UPI001FF76711|nr:MULTISPECIES: AAA family ATPase [unclassified Bradyrhizobium]MCK1619407.1 AAA family ATPase [Bradyrhizobium sp. 159]MCK1754060.1 AAA family ATPase [Bradyrhizobium sp. 137]